MTNHANHPFHLVEKSPWPLMASLSAMMLTTGIAKWFHSSDPKLFLLGLIATLMSAAQWWRDVTREATLQGLHTLKVTTGMRWGMILFIVSEILFFFSFFWAYFHSSLTPTMEIGDTWPPTSINPFNPFQIPLLNTAILLSSGATVTWAHHSVVNNNHTQAVKGMMMTIGLGLYFTALQGLEYHEASFSIADSVFGATFFVATGFHGLHVIIGNTFLIACLGRLTSGHLSASHHTGLEAAIWYWHFVDVVWLFLYITIYWWGSWLSPLLSLMALMMLSLTISVMIMSITLLLGKKHEKNREKASPFECGFDPWMTSRIPFSLRFFIVIIIFLVFDVEVALLLPTTLSFTLAPNAPIMITAMIIIVLMALGLFHEWNLNALEWSK